MIAPHLPPKPERLIDPQTAPTLLWVFIFMFISALTSVALTLGTLVWFAPSFIPDQVVTRIERRGGDAAASSLDPSVINRVRQRLWQIVDTREQLPGGLYPGDATKIAAVVFSSDGWAVAYAPAYRPGTERFWQALDHQGKTYAIERVVKDTVSGLLYLKFTGEAFPFASFTQWDAVAEGRTVWLSEGLLWRAHQLRKPVFLADAKTVPLWRPVSFYEMPSQSGTAVFDSAGMLAGFVNDNEHLIPSWLIEHQYATILQKGKPAYTGVPWRGYMVDGFIEEESGMRRVAGWYISHAPTAATSSTLGVGDVITRLQGEPFSLEAASERIVSAPQEISVTVLRNGKEIDMVVKKEPVQ